MGRHVEPEPQRAFSGEDLVLQLDRLRRRAAAGTRASKIPLSELARTTGIPRSTLHTYLSGSTFPSSDALDAIVIALGSSAPEIGAWARAWDRVADVSRGSRTPSRTANYSRFLTVAAQVRRQLTRPTDRFYDQVAQVHLSERVSVGKRRQLDWLEVRTTVRALEDGVDRFALKIGPKPLFDMDRVLLTDLVNCAPGLHRTLKEPGVRVLEVLFGEPLAAGETHMFEFRVDFLAAHLPDSVVRRDRIPWEPVDSAMHGFPRQGPAFTLEARFSPDDLPDDLRQVLLEHAEGEENKVRDLRLSRWHSANIAVEHPVAGLHGIRWSWPTTRRGSEGR